MAKYIKTENGYKTREELGVAAQNTVNEVYSLAEQANATANNAQVTANNAQATANGKLNIQDPEGRGSFSLNRPVASTIGDYSVAVCLANIASGKASFSEGAHTTASGNYSHAEGTNTTASGEGAHAEGAYTTASGIESHAEGGNTQAIGTWSHAEGINTKASGSNSHAEGAYTQANGGYSHAEGNNTIASGQASHVQGRYNIEDTENKYAHIVGNGTSDTDHSNAHTLDWEGNAWYAGTVEGTAMIIKSSTEGSTKRFKITVDDSGTISATEITE